MELGAWEGTHGVPGCNFSRKAVQEKGGDAIASKTGGEEARRAVSSAPLRPEETSGCLGLEVEICWRKWTGRGGAEGAPPTGS